MLFPSKRRGSEIRRANPPPRLRVRRGNVDASRQTQLNHTEMFNQQSGSRYRKLTTGGAPTRQAFSSAFGVGVGMSVRLKVGAHLRALRVA